MLLAPSSATVRLVIDIGEDLVGAYLREVVGCPVIQFNVRTGVAQGEIDVVALQLSRGRVTEVWLCEVSTHTSGLGGYQGNVAGKFRTKIESVKAYADATYPGATRHIEVWSPKVRPAMLRKLEDVWSEHVDVELVANEEYAARVGALAQIARKTTSYSDSPSFRLLQILTRLPANPLQAQASARQPKADPLDVWNRATSGTPYSAKVGDVALARVLLFHGYAENGGLPEAIQVATETEFGLNEALAAYRYFDLGAAADLIESTFSAQLGVWEREDTAAETRLAQSSSEAYGSLDVEARLTTALAKRLSAEPQDFA
jgi:Holliday junction resolvase-like predicted endonuclease